MKYGDRKPRSNCIPSTTSSSFDIPRPSSVLITPLSPTFSIALAIISPMDASPFAEIVPTCAIAWLELHGRELRFSSATTAPTAASMPRFSSIGSSPAATYFTPSLTIACASTVAVVVPSPAVCDVLAATSRAICAPRFSNRSSSSISFATTTPELMTSGGPKLRSSMTVRPLGPSVTRTALASMLRPAQILSLASRWNLSALAAIADLLGPGHEPPLEHGPAIPGGERPACFIVSASRFTVLTIVNVALGLREAAPCGGDAP